MKTLFVCPCIWLLITSFLLSACKSAEISNQANFLPEKRGVVVVPRQGEAAQIRLQVYDNHIIRVTSSKNNSLDTPKSLMVTGTPKKTDFELRQEGDSVILETKAMRAQVSLNDGKLVVFNSTGEQLLHTSNSGTFSAVTRDSTSHAKNRFEIKQSFIPSDDEAFYGLGQQQNGQVNLAGENLYLTTYNLIITIPYLISTRNVGILWDNNSDSRFGDPNPPKPLFENFTLFDAAGKPGGLTARYYDGEKLLLERIEKDLNYQFLKNNSIREIPLPKKAEQAKNLRIEWLGSLAARQNGEHEILMYSSGYASLFINNKKILDRWRMNWNPWYHNAKVTFKANEKNAIKLEWRPGGGYMRLLSHAPSPESRGELLSLSSDTATAIDYYVVAGNNSDDLISGYRQLTGKATLLPRWAYGFWQSRERYKTQEELINTLKEYRKRKIPIDNVVLDWSYWPEDAWGSHDFDPKYFPDPQVLVDRIHELNAQIMISVWPKFYPTTENYKALNAQGYMLNRNIEEGNKDWIGPGYLNAFYDAFNPKARDLYWQQLDEKINVFGFDAWWLDAVEPDMHSNVNWQKRKEFMSPNYLGSGAEVFNAYALPHAESVYQHDRESAPDTRVFILTRSGFGGMQRTASAVWSGDTVSRWSNLKEQIAAGINTGMAGMPNWTLDIGGFTPEDRFRENNGKFVGATNDMAKEQQAEWRELNTRWYQFGAFLPLYRAHGQNPYREIYNIADEGSPTYQSMVRYTKLRYRLMPYIYSLAGDMYHKDSTLMRGLAMDFANDYVARDINDQYMFGPAFLVNPVYTMGATSRQVYLPGDGYWFDFDSGTKYKGGQSIEAKAPYERLPLFVKAGSIIATGPEIQYADQALNADITLTVYTGADADFELYEDDGRSYDYEKGEFSRIPFRYEEKSGKLTVGERQGSFPEMQIHRKINVRWISGKTKNAANFDAGIANTIDYSGVQQEIYR